MKKINALLHDVTVINFLLVAKLTRRYCSVTWCAVAAVLISVIYLYSTQVTIYSKKVYFKIYSQEDSSKSKQNLIEIVDAVASSLLGHNEVRVILSDYEFVHSLADKLYESSHFSKFDFNSPTQKSFKGHEELFGKCTDKECRVKVIQEIIPRLYSFESEEGTDRFVLSATTRSAVTTLELMKNLKNVLEEFRYKVIVDELDGQIKQTQELISKSRSEIEEKGGFIRVASSESMEALITQQNDKIRGITQGLNNEIDQYHFQQIRLKESGTTAGTDIEEKNKLDYEQFSKVSRRIEHLRQNIASMNSVAQGNRSATDDQVLNQLRDELRTNENEIKKMGPMKRNVAYDDNFINAQINNQSNFEFDYKVSTEKVKKRREEYDNAKKELDRLFAKKAELENGLLTLRPDLEYLKLMESKFVSLKMLKSAAKSDVVFDKFGPEVASFKRNSLIQFIIFSLLIVSFLLFAGLIVIYLFDDRIYDEFEIAKCCDNLHVIGEAPTFE